MRPVFVLGVGTKGREVVRRFKERIERGGGRPYLVYGAVTTKGGESAPLEPIAEDYFLVSAPSTTQISPEALARYGPLAISKPVRQSLAALLCMRDGVQALFSQKVETLFSRGRWVGAPKQAGEDIALYLVVDLADPLSLATLDLVRLAQTASRPYMVQAQAILLALKESPYIYPVLQEAWEALQSSAPLLSRGVFIIERKNEWGDEGTEEERLTAVVEWLERVVNERLPYHEDIERPHLGSWGMAQGIVPKERLNCLFALRWSSQFLEEWIRLPAEPMVLSDEVAAEYWDAIENLVKKPEATVTMPPNYAEEVEGNLAPSPKVQQESARLYAEGMLPDLNDGILSDIQTRISTQEKHRHQVFLRNLQDISAEVLRQAWQRLEAQIQGIFGRSRHPFAETAMLVDRLISRLEEKGQEAEEQVGYLKGLESQGLFQEAPPQKPPSWLSFLTRGLLSLWVGLMGALGLFVVGGGALPLLWRLVTEQPVFFIGALFALFALATLIFVSLRSILIGAGLVIVLLPFLPSELYGFFVLTILLIILATLAFLFGPKFRLYELMVIGPFRPSRIPRNYAEAERMAMDALTRPNLGLLLWRIFLTTMVSVLFVVLANQWLGGNFLDVLNRLGSLLALPLGLLLRREPMQMELSLWVPWWWAWPPLVLTAIVGCLKYVVDHFYDERRQAQGRLMIPDKTYLKIWSFLTFICLAGMVFWSARLGLSGKEQLATLATSVAIALFAIGYYVWQYFNDKSRLSLLVRDWVEWHDGMAFLRFHLEAWREAGEFYRRLLEDVQALKQELQKWRDALHKKANEMGQLAEVEARSLERDAQERRFPNYVMLKTADEFYQDFLREAGMDLEGRLIQEYGAQLWAERSDAAAMDQALSHLIDQRTQAFWQERSIIQFLGPNPDITWMLKPAHPFWSCTNIEAPRKAYLGLPPQVGTKHEYEDYYKVRVSSTFGLVDPKTGMRMDPTRFDEDPWTITTLYYRYGVSPDELGSVSKWKKRYEEELKRLEEELAQPSVPEATAPLERPSSKAKKPRMRRKPRTPKRVPSPPKVSLTEAPPPSKPQPAPDYYQILGVSLDASPEEIEQAYKQRLNELLSNPGPDAEVRWQELNEAYNVLRSKAKKKV